MIVSPPPTAPRRRCPSGREGLAGALSRELVKRRALPSSHGGSLAIAGAWLRRSAAGMGSLLCF